MKAIIIPAKGKPFVKNLDESLHALQSEVGGWLEAVATDTPGISIYINEEGKIEGLPVNENTEALEAAQIVLAPGDFIVGNAIVLGFDEETGEDGNVPFEVMEAVGVEDIEVEDD